MDVNNNGLFSTYDSGHFSAMEQVRILTIQGGGVRGITPAMFCAEIEHRTGEVIWKLFDMVVGVSAGAILGAGFTCCKPNTDKPYTGEEMVTLCKDESKNIFERSDLREWITLDGLSGAKWPVENLNAVLSKHFGNSLLKDCKTELICVSKETTTQKPWYFSRNTAKSNPFLSAIKVRDAVCSSASAPGYFRPNPLRINNQDFNFIDGGMACANPTMEAYDLAGNPPNCLVVSLGTGHKVTPLTYHETAPKGLVGWAPIAPSMLMDSQIQSTHRHMARTLGGKYMRWDTNPDKAVALDDTNPKSIQYLTGETKKFIGQNDKLIQKTCDALKAAIKL